MTKHSATEYAKVFAPSIVYPAYTDASTDGASVDTRGFSQALVYFDAVLAAANAEGNVHIEESADDSTFADITGAVFAEVAPANDVTIFTMSIPLGPRKRYLRAVLATDGANAMTCSVTFILMGPKYGPTSQVETAIVV